MVQSFDPRTWEEYAQLVLNELDEAKVRDQKLLEGYIHIMQKDIATNAKVLEGVKQKATMLGLVAGAIPPTAAYLYKLIAG